ncbi:MAG: stage II sporulation protein D [Bacilli bacterium]|nr:stage II sporulation protein D [Bacilli bacterium]
MIDRYQIKKVNGEDVLFIYLDFNYEFGSFDLSRHKENIKNIIERFIKDAKIAFMGTTVMLIIGTLTLPLKIDNSVNLMNQTNILNKVNISVEEKLENNIPNEIEENNSNVIIELPNNSTNNIDVTKTDVIEKTNSIIEENKIDYNDIKEESRIDYNEIIVDNNIYVSVVKNDEVLNLELEEYVTGVVAAEMPASFSLDALKAQAVLARTYALKAMKTGKTLTSSNATQNYKTTLELKNMWGGSFDTYYYKVKRAVDDTKGLYLSYNNDFIEAVYHSTSNGYTEDSSYVWGNSFPYLVSVESVYDNTNQSFYMETFLSYEDLSSKLNDLITYDTEFSIISYTTSGRVDKISINNNIYSGIKLREKLGLRSTSFEIEKNSLGVVFKTKGYGHGVGMSQYGANGMAKNGYNYKDILTHYYPGTILKNI